MKKMLMGGSDAYDWLRDRGIANRTISKWRLGEVVDPRPGHEQYRGFVSIPYLDAAGRSRGVRFRRLDDRKPKYLSIGGADNHLFAVKYSSERVVYVMTGEFNCMVTHQLGFKAVGVPGDNSWRPAWRWLFRAADEIVVVPDADGDAPVGREPATKGAMFRYKVVASLKGLPALVRVVTLPDDHDVNSLYLEDKRLLKNLLEGR